MYKLILGIRLALNVNLEVDTLLPLNLWSCKWESSRLIFHQRKLLVFIRYQFPIDIRFITCARQMFILTPHITRYIYVDTYVCERVFSMHGTKTVADYEISRYFIGAEILDWKSRRLNTYKGIAFPRVCSGSFHVMVITAQFFRRVLFNYAGRYITTFISRLVMCLLLPRGICGMLRMLRESNEAVCEILLNSEHGLCIWYSSR